MTARYLPSLTARSTQCSHAVLTYAVFLAADGGGLAHTRSDPSGSDDYRKTAFNLQT